MSDVGLINQRYLIVLQRQRAGAGGQLQPGAHQGRRSRSSGPPKTWYRLKTRVDVAPDGSGVVRAKAWKKGEPEPDKWTDRSPAQARAHAAARPASSASRRRACSRVHRQHFGDAELSEPMRIAADTVGTAHQRPDESSPCTTTS